MDATSTATFDDVIAIITTTLGIEDRAIDATTQLLGSLPELDSMAVVELVVALESRFGFVIDDDEVTGEVFDSVASLTRFVEQKVAALAA